MFMNLSTVKQPYDGFKPQNQMCYMSTICTQDQLLGIPQIWTFRHEFLLQRLVQLCSTILHLLFLQLYNFLVRFCFFCIVQICEQNSPPENNFFSTAVFFPQILQIVRYLADIMNIFSLYMFYTVNNNLKDTNFKKD